ncbi:uncharacterized protein LOC116058713 [Sander lucioperca]|uniref:uncharacterized protein LOC116058713 n=1 Tax=Sander lucioperca TaxID=283035 RepID=UPI00125E3E71|nr:uncharacterized protein LOC116058713 [Sander lucioperca]
MELVKELVQKAMPSLSNHVMDSLMARLEEIGVNNVDDLNFVKTEDVNGILPPIQQRRLIQAFSAESQAVLGSASTSLQHNVHLPQTPPPTPGPMEDSPSRETYDVPWHKMPPNLMLALSEKKRPKPKERRELVRIVIDDVLSKERGRPGRAKLREIAKKIVEQYPCSFQDRELNGTKVIGTGYDALFIQLENRLENIRRPFTFSSTKRPAEAEDAVRKKSTLSDRYGCVEWQPAIEDIAELESKQDDLKTCNYQQRKHCKTVLEEWPFLFEAVHLFDHTCTLLGLPVQTKLAEEMSRKGKSIKDFLDSNGMKMPPGEDPVQLISGIAKFFKEKPDLLFYQSEESTAAGLSIPSTPCILIMGDRRFKIAVDQEVVNDHINSLIVALSYAFSLFYVLNIKYPKKMSITLEFIQR